MGVWTGHKSSLCSSHPCSRSLMRSQPNWSGVLLGGPLSPRPYPSFLTPQQPLCSKTAGPKPFSSNPYPRLKAPTSSCHLSHELDPPEMPTGASGDKGQAAQCRRLRGTSLHVRGLTGQWKQEIPQSTATMTSKYFLKASGHEAATCEDTASWVTLG